ncbi:MAG: molybdate ABC transporter substrate-binding protein [Anaerolineae bacterium]
MKPRHAIVLSIVVLQLVLVPVAAAQESQTLTIFAAASLTDVFQEMADRFVELNPAADIIFNFAGSSTLATQLIEGANADVFASANLKQIQAVVDAGRIIQPVSIFARNRLVVITPIDNPSSLSTLSDLARPGVKLILAAPGVPVRDYTDTMLQTLALDADYGSAYPEAVLLNLASEEDNVRQVVAKVALGEADAGIVYQSDVTPDLNDLIQTITIPDEVNVLAAYPIGIIENTPNPSFAKAFVDYALSEDGQAILMKWNFIGKCPASLNLSLTPPIQSTTQPASTSAPTGEPDPAFAGCPA